MINTIPYGAHQEIIKDGKKIIIPVRPALVLQNRGAIIPVTITHPKSVAEKLTKDSKNVPAVRCNALIDTGAFGSVITPKVAED